MRGIWRITLVVVVAASLSALAIVSLQNRTAVNISACGRAGPSDPAYRVAITTKPNPPRASGTDVLITLHMGHQLVSNASVCLSVDMVTMPMALPKAVAKQVSPGVYDDVVVFGMPGTYAATLLVKVGGKAAVSKVVYFHAS